MSNMNTVVLDPREGGGDGKGDFAILVPPSCTLPPKMYNTVNMRSVLLLLLGSVLFTSGCTDRPEVPPSALGTILVELPTLKEAAEPFPFPMEGDNDHQNCVFNEKDFM